MCCMLTCAVVYVRSEGCVVSVRCVGGSVLFVRSACLFVAFGRCCGCRWPSIHRSRKRWCAASLCARSPELPVGVAKAKLQERIPIDAVPQTLPELLELPEGIELYGGWLEDDGADGAAAAGVLSIHVENAWECWHGCHDCDELKRELLGKRAGQPLDGLVASRARRALLRVDLPRSRYPSVRRHLLGSAQRRVRMWHCRWRRQHGSASAS